MPSTGSRLSGSLWKRQLRSSCTGPAMPIEMADSKPSSRRTLAERLAHGQSLATTRRYRPAATGHHDDPSAVIRSSIPTGLRSNAPDVMPSNLTRECDDHRMISLGDLVRPGMRIAVADG